MKAKLLKKIRNKFFVFKVKTTGIYEIHDFTVNDDSIKVSYEFKSKEEALKQVRELILNYLHYKYDSYIERKQVYPPFIKKIELSSSHKTG